MMSYSVADTSIGEATAEPACVFLPKYWNGKHYQLLAKARQTTYMFLISACNPIKPPLDNLGAHTHHVIHLVLTKMVALYL